MPASVPSDALVDLVLRVAAPLHSDDSSLTPQDNRLAAATVLAQATQSPLPVTDQDATSLIRILVYKCLHSGYLHLAAQLLWPASLFNPNPRVVKMIWRNVAANSATLLMGAASMGKTYTPGVMFYLEWQRDPEFTNVICVGPSEEHLEANLFSHLVKLHQSTSIPMPGEIGKRWIGLNTRNKRGGIRGVVIPVGKKAAGRIQGTKRHPRTKPHPIFGKLSRLFLLLDELENVPPGVHSDVENVLSTSGEEPDGFKIVGAYNPKDTTARPYRMAEPLNGWEKFNADTDEEWVSKQDWSVVRLDALKTENVQTGEVVFSGLQTLQGYNKLVKAAGGPGSPGYWTFGRGCYPPLGSSSSAVPAHLFDQHVAEVIFVERPASVSGADLALEGGDKAWVGHGLFGAASGIVRSGVFTPFFNSRGEKTTRQVLQFMGMYDVEKGDTIATAHNVKTQAKVLGTRPNRLLVDRTGNGAGVHDHLKNYWDVGVLGVNYSESPTRQRVMKEDEGTAEDRFPRVDSEIILATRDWLEYGYLWLHPSFDMTEVRAQLSERKQYAERGKQAVESKKDYKAAHAGKSPDEGDTFCLTVHVTRVVFAPELTMLPENSAAGLQEMSSSLDNYVDPTNIVEDIDF